MQLFDIRVLENGKINSSVQTADVNVIYIITQNRHAFSGRLSLSSNVPKTFQEIENNYLPMCFMTHDGYIISCCIIYLGQIGSANSADPDQTALIRVYTVCHFICLF